MKVSKDTVVTIDYRLHLGDGKTFDQSTPDDPLVYLHGYEEIVPGLEKALEGKAPGDTLTAVVPPEEGYGDYDPEGVQEVPREELPEDLELEAGGTLFGTDDEGDEMEALVKEVKEKTVVLDFNPPLAGKTLHFEVKVREVRPATREELEHGHAHGPGHEH